MTRLGLLSFLSASAVTLALVVRPARPTVPNAKPAVKTAKAAVVASPKIALTPPTVAPKSSATTALIAEIAITAPWGAGKGELGHEIPSEAMPEAPMSLAVDAAGNVWVLDQVNMRVVIFDANGTVRRTIPIANRIAQDLAPIAGGVTILDRLVDKAIVFLDDTGHETHRVALAGPGVDEPSGVTGLFVFEDPADPLSGAWVEYEHRGLVRVALPDHTPDPARLRLDGRRVPNSTRLLRAARDPAGFALVSALGPNGFLARVPTPQPILQLEGLFGDRKGRTWVAAHTYEEGAKHALVDQRVTVVALDPTGAEIGRADLPPPEVAGDQLVPTTVGADDCFYQLHVGKTGATIWRVR